MATQRRDIVREGGLADAALCAAALLFGLGLVGGCASSQKSTENDEKASSEELPDPSEQKASKDRAESTEEQDESAEGGSPAEGGGDGGGEDGGESKPLIGSVKDKIASAVDKSEQGNDARAKKILNRFVDDSDAGFLASYNLGVIAEKEGDISAAANHYTKTLKKNPDFTPALLNLVRLYIRYDRVRDADEIARKYTDARPENLDHRVAKLEVMLAKEDYRDVIREAKKLLRRDERNVEAMLAMAKANFELERYEFTTDILERVSELAPERAEIYFIFGLVAMENENRGRAISNFEKALEHNPRLAEAHNNLGLLYQEAGDFQAAAEQFRAAVDDYPNFLEATLNLGIALKQLEKKKKAEEKFKEVISMDSNYADAYFNLGVLYLDSELGDLEKIPRLEKSIEFLNKYKRKAAGRLDGDDPVDDYIKSARDQIEAEKERQEMMRKSQQSAQSGGDSDQGSDGGGGNGDGSSNDGGGESEK